MRAALFVLCALLALVGAQGPPEPLRSQRMATAAAWVVRANSPAQMAYAFANVVNQSTITHALADVGAFGPGRILAEEYDDLVFFLAAITYSQPLVMLNPAFDPATTKWLTADVLQVDYLLNASAGYNGSVYLYHADGMFYRQYLVFDPNSPLLNLGFDFQDEAGIKLFASGYALIPAASVCAGIIFPACNVTRGPANGFDACPNGPFGDQNCLNAAGFSSVGDCINFLDARIAHPSPCPYLYKANTEFCRVLHGFSSFGLAQVHCHHLPPVNPVCQDECLPACANCDANAQCVPTYPGIPLSFAVTYECQCKPGYTGDGTTCTANICQSVRDCPFNTGQQNGEHEGENSENIAFGTCVANLCGCKNTFAWNSSTAARANGNVCACPPESQLFLNGSTPVCIPSGRCLKKSQCTNQKQHQVQCLPYGVNPYTPWLSCICNPGYLGGREYPCVCPAGHHEEWSEDIEGLVCVANA